jgi:hypothetical protein
MSLAGLRAVERKDATHQHSLVVTASTNFLLWQLEENEDDYD